VLDDRRLVIEGEGDPYSSTMVGDMTEIAPEPTPGVPGPVRTELFEPEVTLGALDETSEDLDLTQRATPSMADYAAPVVAPAPVIEPVSVSAPAPVIAFESTVPVDPAAQVALQSPAARPATELPVTMEAELPEGVSDRTMFAALALLSVAAHVLLWLTD